MWDFDFLSSVLILLAGVGAGAINAAVGSGTLITFPALVGFGVPPQIATMSNAIGLIPGNIASSFGYREEIRGQGKRLANWLPASILGALIGAFLLLHLPETAFESIVPVLIVLALVMVVVQPALQKFLKRRKAAGGSGAGNSDGEVVAGSAGAPGSAGTRGGSAASGGEELGEESESSLRKVVLFVLIGLTGVYGGYFAAAQGIILIGILGLLVSDPLQKINGIKNVLVLGVNTVAAACYVIVGWQRINWAAVILVAIGSLVGGYFGARVARKINPMVLRGIIVVLGLFALWRILNL